ncbi:MAG: tRNA preQ1(34) S-adenosylmethionine ribosyltransferase-isomerase QueA [Thermoplasmatota archaeon]
MELDLFDYDLPREMIAQSKSDPRDSSRLFYMDARGERTIHRHHVFRDIVGLLDKGDILVLNRSRVIPARIPVRKVTGGRAEVLLLKGSDDGSWEALVRGRNIKKDERLLCDDEDLEILMKERMHEGRCRIAFRRRNGPMDHSAAMEWLRRWGLMPTPPYIKRILDDPEEYQTVYGDMEGSVAAPTAGLHFTEGLLERLREKGVRIVHIILHVGPGTFAPVRSKDINDHIMEEEEFLIPESVKDTVRDAVEQRDSNGANRIWAVGTTTMRSLESAFDEQGECIREKGKTDLFITPGYQFKLPYKGFITNFHLPRSTPLMLVSAFHDRESILAAYHEAMRMGYRFYSLGDSMMIRRG